MWNSFFIPVAGINYVKLLANVVALNLIFNSSTSSFPWFYAPFLGPN